MVKKEIFESLRLPLASVLIEFQKIILTIYCVFRMVSLMGPHGSHRSIFSLQATGILIWSQWKNSEGVGKSVRSVRSVWENKKLRRSQKFVKFERFVFENKKLRKESKIREIREIRVRKQKNSEGVGKSVRFVWEKKKTPQGVKNSWNSRDSCSKIYINYCFPISSWAFFKARILNSFSTRFFTSFSILSSIIWLRGRENGCQP